MNLWAIRHTKTEVQEGICYGQSDVGLAETSIYDLEKAVASFNNQKFDIIYSSPLIRCAILAQHIAQGQEIIYDSRLKELNFGQWELIAWNDIFNTPYGKHWMDNYIETPCPDGESYMQLFFRIQDFYNEILLKHTQDNVLLVTHSGCIIAFHSLLLKITPEVAFKFHRPDFGQIIKLL